VASLTIEQINQDRERFLEAIRKNVSPELNKIGLYLINVNITDITDESGYIDSIGKKAAATLLLTEKLEQIVGLQVEAIRNIRIEKVTVWDGGGKDGTATAQFLSGLVKSLPPLHEVAGLAGLELPRYLGQVAPGAGLADPGPDRPC
jgi:hypothetical protein